MPKRKITLNDMPEYYNSVTYSISESGKTIPGVLYYLDKQPTDFYKQQLASRFQNVKWMIAQSQYAPEQKKPCLFVGRTCF